MPFTVNWGEDDIEDLTTVWLGALDRQAVTQAQAQIDLKLAKDPLAAGHEVSERLKKIHVSPLTVYYAEDTVDHLVDIEAIDYLP